MESTLTLINIYGGDHAKVGRRAVDLARVAQARYPVPLCFVIPCGLYDEFLEQSGIKDRISGIYDRHAQTIDGYARAYKEVRELFHRVSFSREIKEELLEAYASLAIPSKEAGASDLVGGEDDPAVVLIPSPDYLLRPERLDGVQQNIIGGERFLDAIKECWLSGFLPELVRERQQFSVERFSMGIIVQQQLPGDSAEGFYRRGDEHPIRVHGYFGLSDPYGEVIKDEHLIAKEHLRVVKTTVKQQPFKLYPEEQSGVVGQSYLQDKGAEQALSERQVLEVARLTKRVHLLLEQDIRLFCSVKDERVTVLLALKENHSSLTQIVDESPSPASVMEDEYVPVEEAFSRPVPSEEGSAAAAVEEDEPVPAEEVSVYDEQAEESFSEPVTYDVQEPSVEDGEEGEEPLADGEETLFDLFQQEDRPVERSSSPSLGASAFIDEVVAELEEAMERSYKELYGRHSRSTDELVSSLDESGSLPVPKDVVDALLAAHDRLQGSFDPEDHEIGLAWRVRSSLAAREG
ncbi:hypothetical protein JXA12_06120 [Candidatus Woesearchaeota archaeon]|nr:hypothetical protein [Candidatus Woesearchaeota archaeon]